MNRSFKDLPSKYLYKLRSRVNYELKCRSQDRDTKKDNLIDGWRSFANFMNGVAHALACRAVLRWSVGLPPYGPGVAIGLASGEMWSPKEIAKAFMYAERQCMEATLHSRTNPLDKQPTRGYCSSIAALDLPVIFGKPSQSDQLEIPF
jgi:hypothetical protein